MPTQFSRRTMVVMLGGTAVGSGAAWSHDLRPGDPDAKSFQADIVALARGEVHDRRNAEILEDLGAQSDLAPFVLAAPGLGMVLVPGAGRPVA